MLTREQYEEGEEFDEEVGRLVAPSCFGEHSLDFIPKADRKLTRGLFNSEDQADEHKPKMLRLASGQTIVSPAVKKAKEAVKRGPADAHMRNTEAPPIWRDTIITDPSVPVTSLLWMSREHFVRSVGHLREVLQKNEMQKLINRITVFQDLRHGQRLKLAESINKRMMITKQPGEIIYAQGEEGGDVMYIVLKGSIKISQVADDGSVIVLNEALRKGTYFGETSFVKDEPRDATAAAAEVVDIIALSRATVNKVLGSMSVIVDSEMSRRAYQKRLAQADSFQQKDLVMLSTLGTGTFGRVTLVHHSPTGGFYAYKSMRKDKLCSLKHLDHAINEKKILASINHPFLNQLVAVMTDKSPSGNVYLMLELCLGGELFTLLRQAGCFDLSTTTFYAACVASALVHLHTRRIVYRDLKPENLVFNSEGYVVVIDFGFAKPLSPGAKTYTLCGTPQYLAPEIVTSQGHGFPADRWAFGILLFEMLTGNPPFDDSSPMGIYKQIMNNRFAYPVIIKGLAKDLISQLLISNPQKRLGGGSSGSQAMMEDAFFAGYDFDLLERKEYVAPWMPELADMRDTRHFEIDQDQEAEDEAADHLQWAKVRGTANYEHDVSRLDMAFGSMADSTYNGKRAGMSTREEKDLLNAKLKNAAAKVREKEKKKKQLLADAQTAAIAQKLAANSAEGDVTPMSPSSPRISNPSPMPSSGPASRRASKESTSLPFAPDLSSAGGSRRGSKESMGTPFVPVASSAGGSRRGSKESTGTPFVPAASSAGGSRRGSKESTGTPFVSSEVHSAGFRRRRVSSKEEIDQAMLDAAVAKADEEKAIVNAKARASYAQAAAEFASGEDEAWAAEEAKSASRVARTAQREADAAALVTAAAAATVTRMKSSSGDSSSDELLPDGRIVQCSPVISAATNLPSPPWQRKNNLKGDKVSTPAVQHMSPATTSSQPSPMSQLLRSPAKLEDLGFCADAVPSFPSGARSASNR